MPYRKIIANRDSQNEGLIPYSPDKPTSDNRPTVSNTLNILIIFAKNLDFGFCLLSLTIKNVPIIERMINGIGISN